MSKTASAARGPHSTPHTELLIKNLRLLDLDEEFDWPRIKPSTFSATSTSSEQRERVRCAEWILYKLFDLWDPKETTTSLADFFPTLEPKQSLGLRAAFSKHFTELKKNGILGKDIQIRRTMFDDCRGPRFEELLAVFSTMVLHKVLSDDTSDASISNQAILATTSYDKQQMLPLNLAYRASCGSILRQREAHERRWHKFGRTLRANKDDLEHRQRLLDNAVAQRREKKIPQRTLERLRRHTDANWSGEKEWLEILMRSDQHRPQKRLLERDFAGVWSYACADTLYAVRPENNDSLLQNLEKRVDAQNERLDRWKRVKEGLGLQAQALGMIETRNENRETPGELTNIDSGTSSKVRSGHIRKGSRHFDQQEHFDSPLTSSSVIHSPNKARAPSATESMSYFPPQKNLQSSPTRLEPPYTRTPSVPYHQEPLSPYFAPELSPSRRNFASVRSEPIGEQDAMAAHILNSVMNAEPSPFKQAQPPSLAPSLAERTRMSMARMSPQKTDLQPALELHNTRQESPERRPTTPEHIQTLAERTRQSMSLMSAKPKPHQSRKSRVSRTSQVYPTNQFETPRKPHWVESAETPFFDETMEELDAESIFKSRPRVAVSPIVQPTPGPGVIDEVLLGE